MTLNQFDYRNKNAADNIVGFDLTIDSSVHELCSRYNSTSSATRSVLYVLLIVLGVSFITVVNTERWGWSSKRLQNIENSLKIADSTYRADRHDVFFAVSLKKGAEDSLRLLNKNNGHSTALKKELSQRIKKQSTNVEKLLKKYVSDSIALTREVVKINEIEKNKIQNDQRVSIPVLGNSFDVNDLSPITGPVFLMLLLVLRFTIGREKDSLLIAFGAISERYHDSTLEKDLLEKIPNKIKSIPNFETLINFKRRRYHYNYITTNEVFNFPYIDLSYNRIQRSFTGRFIKKNIFDIPFLFYCLIYANDISTIDFAWQHDKVLTTISTFFGFVFFILIAKVCEGCTYIKDDVNHLFDAFYKNDYYYERSSFLAEHSAPFKKQHLLFRMINVVLFPIYYLYRILKSLTSKPDQIPNLSTDLVATITANDNII